MPEIQLDHRIVAYSVRKSNRARRGSLKIDPEKGLQVILPAGESQEVDVEAMLLERKRWILKHLPQTTTRTYQTGEVLPFLGEPHTLEVVQTQKGKRTVVGQQANTLRVRLRSDVPPAEQPIQVRAALEAWYRGQAKTYLAERAAHFGALHGFTFEKITIKGQKTRWGSCSSKGNLNFNWRLMLAPPAAVDYVVIHELCHLIEMNHSPRFWALVADYCPAYTYWIKWLKDHHHDLYL
jgi:predicted metal-dependent hydrolase